MAKTKIEHGGLEMAHLRELEVEAYFVECVVTTPEAINEEYTRLTSDVAYWNERYARATETYLLAKAERERTEGRLLCDAEMVAELGERLGKKPTVDQIKGEILVDPKFEEAKTAEIAAEVERIRCRGAVEALATKRDMLVSLGATLREDMKRELLIRDE